MIRSLVCSLACSLVVLLTFPGSPSTPPSSPSGSPSQGTLGQPLLLGPWQVTVERASASQWKETSVLNVMVTLHNTSATPQPLGSTAFFTCYREDVWQGLPFLESHPLPPSIVAPGRTFRGIIRYQRPPDVLTFGLVFFWQAPSGDPVIGIWSLQVRD